MHAWSLCVRFWPFLCLCARLCMGIFALAWLMPRWISLAWQRMTLSCCFRWMCQIQATDLDVCVCMHNEQKRCCWMLSALSKLWNLTRNALSFFLVLDRPLWCRERSQQGKDVHGHCWFRGLLLLTLTSVASCSLLNIHKQIKTLQLIGWPPFHSLTHSAACSALRFVSFYRESHGPCWIEAPRGMFVRFDCQFAYTGRRDCTHTPQDSLLLIASDSE